MKYPNIIKNLLRKPSFIAILNIFLLKYLKLKKILDPEINGPGRFFMAKPEDIFIISYPKSGNTWLRFIIANLIFQGKKINLNNIDDYVGDLATNNEKKLLNQRSPRFFNSHDFFEPRFSKVIYIVRDPRDVITSMYFYLINLGVIKKNYSKRKYFKRFINGDFNANFGNWNDNVGSWTGVKDEKKIIIIKYENLNKNTYKEIKRICAFLKIKKTKNQIGKAIKKSSLIELRKMESNQKGFKAYISKDNPGFFRKGKTGDWKNFLSKTEAKLVKNMWKKNMKGFGYI